MRFYAQSLRPILTITVKKRVCIKISINENSFKPKILKMKLIFIVNLFLIDFLDELTHIEGS